MQLQAVHPRKWHGAASCSSWLSVHRAPALTLDSNAPNCSATFAISHHVGEGIQLLARAKGSIGRSRHGVQHLAAADCHSCPKRRKRRACQADSERVPIWIDIILLNVGR